MKRFLLIIASLVLISGVFTTQKVEAAGFSDVPTSHGFYDEVMYLLNKGVIDAKPKFGVNDQVTRAEVATMVSKALGLDGKPTATPFKDVPASHAASGYINSAVKAGIIKGYTPDTFKPTGIVNRGEMAIFLARAFKLTTESSTNFKDMSSSMASFSSVKLIVQAKITTGYGDNTFRPTEKLTRGQISAFLARAMQTQGGAAPTPKPTPTPPPVGTTGNLQIVSKDLSKEVVGIKNMGTSAVNLTGWKLVSVEGNQTYTFPSYNLAPGATVFVTSGPNAQQGGAYLKWTGSNMWNNSGDAAKLVDGRGVVIHELK